MQTANFRTQIHAGQYEIIKELFVADPMSDIIDSFSTVYQQDQLKGAYLCLFGENFFDLIQSITEPETTARISATQLTQLWSGEIDLKTTFADSQPSLPILRVAILQVIIETLHERYPERRITHPILDSFSNLEGMARIRELFKQYITKTTPGSLERYKLALEILLEKENLGLPSQLESEEDITQTAGFAPGDFSHLDLSYLDLRRDDGQDGGFKNLILHHSNCDGSNWSGLSLLEADFTGGSLQGANLSKLSNNEGINLRQTDIEGSYFGEDYIADRRAKNHTKISRTEAQFITFPPELLKITVEKNKLERFKTAYFDDYHSGFFKNPFSTMKEMLDHGRIDNMKKIIEYAHEHPNTRTARVIRQFVTTTADEQAPEPSSSSTCQTP